MHDNPQEEAEFTSGMYRKGKIPALFYPNLMETSWDSSDLALMS